jgi:LysR family transcriptional regulator, chromosome initiation inhibitor
VRHFDPFALECLATVVEDGGFERAANRLNVTQSAVSQRLRALESAAGTVLLERTRPVRPTPAGALLIKHTKQLRLLRGDLDADLSELGGDTGRLRGEEERISIAANADSIATWALDALSPLVRKGMPLELITDDQDFTLEWLRSGQVMGCITALSQALRGCTVTPLGTMPYLCVAEKKFAKQHAPQGITPQNFSALPFVAFNRKDDLHAEFVAQALGLKQVRLRQRYVPSTQGQVQAALEGWGAAAMPAPLAEPLLKSGQLVDLLPGKRWPIALYWHCWSLPSEILRQVSDALVQAARSRLEQH